MKLLSIGNSFSQDAQRWLHDLATAAGEELYTRNLYIGGCPLSLHYENLLENKPAYAYETNGIGENAPASSIVDALKSEDWDVVTIQQVSQSCGRPETYEPYLGVLVGAMKKYAPNARLMFQQTWEYEKGSGHGGFPYFECSCDLMYGSIRATVSHFAAQYGLEILPSGDAVHAAKKLDAFNPELGGQSLYRDRFHMHLQYGRYLLACVWYKKLLGKSPVGIDFAPEGAERSLCELLAKVADEVVK